MPEEPTCPAGLQIDRRLFLVGGAASLLSCGSDEGSPSPLTVSSSSPGGAAQGRTLGIVPTEPEGRDFGEVIDLLDLSGARNASLSLYWDEIETTPGTFAPDPDWIAIANRFYASRDLPPTVSLSGIDTNNDRRPADLASLPYDHPRVVARYLDLARWVIGRLPDVEITCFSIGNEIDATLAGDRDAWARYRAFFARIAPELRRLRSGLVVGSKATFGVIANDPAREEYARLLDDADAAMMTYYPLAADFSVRPVSEVGDDFEAMASLAGNTPLRILECGYPSAALSGSSEAQQADFVRAVFAAWDRQSARISQIDFFALHDFNPATVAQLTGYYGISSASFAAFLGSLGLRHWGGDGAAKPAWNVFVEQAQARGFA